MGEGALDRALKENAKTKSRQQGGQNGGGSSSPITVNQYDIGEVVSALQKSIRRGDEPQALYWASEMMASDQTYRMWRRLIVIAAEDVGLADPDMVQRIMVMKQAHDIGREWNIPFLAVMLLCRAGKNREADDAAWYYECRRKQGWKIPMPAVAIDGHTRAGKNRLYAMARQQGTTMEKLWDIEFYGDAALLKHYEPDEFHGIEDPWKHALFRFLGLEYDTYDVDECRMPRLLTGGAAAKAAEDLLVERVPDEPTFSRSDPETGELVENTVWVQSFTDAEIWYRVHEDIALGTWSCTCPAFANAGAGGTCKHAIAVLRSGILSDEDPDD